jgi:hypothetical protein
MSISPSVLTPQKFAIRNFILYALKIPPCIDDYRGGSVNKNQRAAEANIELVMGLKKALIDCKSQKHVIAKPNEKILEKLLEVAPKHSESEVYDMIMQTVDAHHEAALLTDKEEEIFKKLHENIVNPKITLRRGF